MNREPRAWRWGIAVVLLVSALLRIALVLQGGQFFFSDEDRYNRGVEIYLAGLGGHWDTARSLAMMPEHMLFTAGATLLAPIHHLLAQLTPFGAWVANPVYPSFTMWIAASLLSLFSTLNLYLTYRLARALGAARAEASWAMLLAATTNALFYHVRHLLPYECALSFALLALIAGLGAASAGRALLCGLLAAVAYGVYNGYWYLVPLIFVVHAVAVWRQPDGRKRIVLCGAGAVLCLVLPVLFGLATGGARYWNLMRQFGRSAKQGEMSEGWSLPWAYFWHAEGMAGVALVAVVAAALALVWRRRETLEPRVRLVLLTLGLAYGLLIVGSMGLGVFVVYGRTVLPFVPLACVLGGWALHRLLTGRQPGLQALAAAAALVAGALHFWPHFSRVFPREIEISVLRHWGNPKHTLSVSGSFYTPLTLPVSRPDLLLVNAQMLFPVIHPLPLPDGKTLFRLEHPLTFLPFQYEGFRPRDREFLRAHDISIRLIQLADPASVPDDLPPRLRLTGP